MDQVREAIAQQGTVVAVGVGALGPVDVSFQLTIESLD
jgi:hypothetical protein